MAVNLKWEKNANILQNHPRGLKKQVLKNKALKTYVTNLYIREDTLVNSDMTGFRVLSLRKQIKQVKVSVTKQDRKTPSSPRLQ